VAAPEPVAATAAGKVGGKEGARRTSVEAAAAAAAAVAALSVVASTESLGPGGEMEALKHVSKDCVVSYSDYKLNNLVLQRRRCC